MALGFQLLGSHATICAQLEQIEQEKVAATKGVEMNSQGLRVKMEKSDISFQSLSQAKNVKESMEK